MTGCAVESEQITSNFTTENENTSGFENYIGKIWVPDEYDEKILKFFQGECEFYFTFYISKIDDKNIEGKFEISDAIHPAAPTCYIHDWEPMVGSFAGTIDGNKAECIFVDNSRENWNQGWDPIYDSLSKFCSSGYLTIEFWDDMACDVSVKYIDNDSRNDEDYSSTYRPYNISDYDIISNNTKITKSVNLDNWGNINVEIVLINSGKPYSMIFFTDASHDIIYQFPSYPSAPQGKIDYSEIEIIDLDQDGIDDIRITPFDYDWDNPMDAEPIIYYQRKDGLFFESYLNREGVF